MKRKTTPCDAARQPLSHLPQAGVILQPNWLPVRGALLGRSVTRHALAGRVTRKFGVSPTHRTIYEFWTTRPHAPSSGAECLLGFAPGRN